ncbi:MAG: transcription-repair coupling factor [Bacillota bacterium]|nr:transcription-repair coupling factor [Bacillota bacterium]
MRLDGLLKPLQDSRDYNEIIDNINKGKFPIGVFGLSESARSYFIDAIYEKMDKSFIIVTHNDVEAKNLYEDLSFYVNNIYYLPSKELVFYNIEAISADLRWERLKVLREIIRKSKKIIVLSIESLISTCVPMELYDKYTFKYKMGDNIYIEELSEKLIQCGYEKTDIVESKGQFSVRGGIIDIYPPISAVPFRIELFGDEIDSIRSFNTESQRSIEKVNKIEIFPAKEMILNKDNIERATIKIKEDLNLVYNNLMKKDNTESADRIKSIINSNLEELKEKWSFETIDSFMPYFYEKTSTLLDYMKDYFIFLDDTQRCKGKLDSVYFEFEESYKSFFDRGNILPGQGKLQVPKDVLIEMLESSNIVTLNTITKSSDILKPKSMVSFSEITLHQYHGQLDLLLEEIKDKKSRGFKTIILSGTRPRGERLVDTLRDRDVESSYSDVIRDVQFGEVVITFGNQVKGFEYPDLKLCVISDKEVFGESKRRPNRKTMKKGVGKISSFTELKPGDYIVHTNHGIGVYKGIKQLEVQGHKKDYLELSYDSDDKLFVPVEQLELVQKYIGTEGKSPKVTKLGGTDWIKAKSKVQKSVNEMAEDLIKLYAARSTLKGHRFSKDTIWQKQFEDEFPYQETQDQLIAIEDIKKDMESDKAMDRLLCGDVGYGKTEVAVRAAFKAVMDGKQVAFLVPTTILAQQHYNNLVKRFSDFPIKVDMICRFRTPAQQRNIITAAKEGNLDILIGTHKILSKDMHFKDLGLLIIDEEQRFGVTHKEKIKEMKKNIDVLTLTATPIPRTLHMSLVGVRDISIIETPPEERYPIQTYVVEYNDQLIRDAVMREMARNGQVYFVYNRVETINDMAAYLKKLVPEARIAIGHGQMSERELENIIVDFMNNEYDILLCSTIIETGMDIQNVNTMIIYDSDRMGLSQLYQLRGRVGRTNRIAYAYLTYRKDKVLTEVAEKRLKAIKDFTELGSGFKIAMKDLEIRGAGNMMGSAQHGHMAAIGYDLYCRMLEDMVKRIKGEDINEPIETTIDIKIDAFIPRDYIEDEVQKIEVYKKIAAISSYEDMMDVQEEIEDRFSNIPEPVQNLMNIAFLRSMSKMLDIEEIKDKNNQLSFQFSSNKKLNENVIFELTKKYKKQLKFKSDEKPAFLLDSSEIKKENLILFIKEVLDFLKSLFENE